MISFWRRGAGLGKPFWIFWMAAALFDCGMFFFTVLHDLYLLDRGFREAMVGFVNSAVTAGNVAGALPAGAWGQQFGLRRTLLVCFLGSGALFGLRAVVSGQGPLLVLAFLSGVVSAIWFVSLAPSVTQLTSEEKRSVGFSVFFASNIALGILAGLFGGRLPRWLLHWGVAASPAQAKQVVLLLGCACVALAAWPAAHLRFPPAAARARDAYPRSPFLARFLIAAAVWNLATGAFNPFFDVYFSRHLKMAAEQVGLVFSGGQLTQVGAMLLTPILLRRFGVVSGISGMQVATGLALGLLAAGPGAVAAGVTYSAYMAFQWMSEPGFYTLLMSQVRREEQSGASALNFLVMFSSQAIAAAAAGAAFARFGYPAVLGSAALVAVAAGLLFRVLLRHFDLPAGLVDGG